MYLPSSSIVCLFIIILSLLGWGTAANALVELKVSPGVYHFDFILWRTIWCFIICIILGSKWCPPSTEDWWTNLKNVFHSGKESIWVHVGGVSLAGITDMIFQVFLFSSIDGSGLSSSVPLQLGTTTLFGSFLTLMVDKRANIYYFIPGVILNLIAVFVDAITYTYLSRDNQNKDVTVEDGLIKDESKERFSTVKVAIICITGAIIGIPFGPGMALAAKEPNALSPYSTSFLMCLSGCLFTPIASYLLMRFPFRGPKTSFKDWFHCTWKQRWPAIWGSLYWTIGTISYALAATGLGNPIAYIFGQSTPFVTSLYSIFYWKEFKNAGKKTWFLEILMLSLFFASLLLICFAQQ